MQIISPRDGRRHKKPPKIWPQAWQSTEDRVDVELLERARQSFPPSRTAWQRQPAASASGSTAGAGSLKRTFAWLPRLPAQGRTARSQPRPPGSALASAPRARNGRARERKLTIGSDTVAIRAPRVNDKRVDPATGERRKFSSKILPAYARRSPKVTEVLPVLYLHGLSTRDFEPALRDLLGEDAAGLSPASISRLTSRKRRTSWSRLVAVLASSWAEAAICWVEAVVCWVEAEARRARRRAGARHAARWGSSQRLGRQRAR